MDSYLQRQISPSDCKISSNCGKNGFPCFSFGFISHIVGKLALQDAFICLHVFSNYCQLSGSKIWFPLYNPWFPLFFSALFPVRSSESMFTQIQKNFVLHSLRSLPAKPVCQVGIPFAGRFIPRVANLSLE